MCTSRRPTASVSHRYIDGGVMCSIPRQPHVVYVWTGILRRLYLQTWPNTQQARPPTVMETLMLHKIHWWPLEPTSAESEVQSIASQIYPTWLQLGDPESEGKIVNYLDMSIWQQDCTWQSKLYDKRVELQAKGLKLNISRTWKPKLPRDANMD